MFLAVKFTANLNSDQCSYSRYGIGFGCYSLLAFSNIDSVKHVVTSEVDNSSRVHIDNKWKYVLVLDIVQHGD